MKKNILFFLLVIALIVEAALALLCFFTPAKALEIFGISHTADTVFLVHIIAWFCLLVTIFIGYIIFLFKNNDTAYNLLLNVLCFWWIALGLTIFLKFDKIDNLLLDSLKAVLLLGANFAYSKQQAKL